mgnify:CR=1 FL=1
MIVTLLELPVNFDILDVEDGVVREPFFEAPILAILNTEETEIVRFYQHIRS